MSPIFVSPAPVPADCDPARGLALPALHPELSRRRGAACAAWARPLLREHPQLGAEIWPDDRATAAATPSSAEPSLAPRRDGGADRRQTDVPLACGRSEGEILQRRRDRGAAVKLMRKLLRKQGFAPKRVTTDQLGSYRLPAPR